MKIVGNIATAIISGVLVVPITWWMVDRDPPYIRESGRVVPVSHTMCGLETGPPLDGSIHPGSCLEVEWTILPLRACKPAGPFNVTRAIIDQQGRHQLPATHSTYSNRSSRLPPPSDDDIIRYFALPPHGPLGPATYESSAAFACNPLQEFFRPIIVNMPTLPFTVGLPSQQGPK